MTAQDFNSLQYGNTIQDTDSNQLFIVTFVNRDQQGNTTEVGVTPAFAIGAAAGLNVVSKNVGQTILSGNVQGQLVLTGKTIQGPAVVPALKKK